MWRSPDRSTRRLLDCGAIAGPLFVTTFLIEGARRRDYDPRRHPVSSLALGPGGWRQTGNFLVAGSLYLAGAVGLARASRATGGTRAGPVLVGTAAIGLIGAGVFITDPVSGYPPGTPEAPAGFSRTGALHDAFSAPTFLGLPIAQLLFARAFSRDRDRAWASYSRMTAAVTGITFVLASAAFGQVRRLVARGGLFQRISVVTGFAWLTAISVRARRAVDRGHGLLP
jgi:hypothetical protein